MSSLHLSFTLHYMAYSLFFVEIGNNCLLPFKECTPSVTNSLA